MTDRRVIRVLRCLIGCVALAGGCVTPVVRSEAPSIVSNEYGAYAEAPEAPEIGDVVIDFDLPRVGGGTFRLAEARAEGPVVVVFYSGFT